MSEEDERDFTPAGAKKLAAESMDHLDAWHAEQGITTERAEMKATLTALQSRVAALEAALAKFRDFYPMGINPELDDAWRCARSALAGTTDPRRETARRCAEPTLYVDTEFNGFGGALMSLAIVASDGREWYEVLPLPEVIDPWVAENVVPVLGKEPIGPTQFRESLHAFLSAFTAPHVVADWYTDLAIFFAQMAGDDHFSSFAFYGTAEVINADYVSAQPHNALADARALAAAIRAAYNLEAASPLGEGEC